MKLQYKVTTKENNQRITKTRNC